MKITKKYEKNLSPSPFKKIKNEQKYLKNSCYVKSSKNSTKNNFDIKSDDSQNQERKEYKNAYPKKNDHILQQKKKSKGFVKCSKKMIKNYSKNINLLNNSKEFYSNRSEYEIFKEGLDVFEKLQRKDTTPQYYGFNNNPILNRRRSSSVSSSESKDVKKDSKLFNHLLSSGQNMYNTKIEIDDFCEMSSSVRRNELIEEKSEAREGTTAKTPYISRSKDFKLIKNVKNYKDHKEEGYQRRDKY